MGIKVKLDNEDVNEELIDIPLFATADDAVKNIKVEDSNIQIQIEEEDA
ncbi:MAG: hypothetical protein LUG12_08990 [Erysipelotrichaceae bacterium]|nr:hypothetical protein [Erysipelotrichaceae bacterium]